MYNFIALLTTAFWIWMILDCIKNDPDRQLWMWVLILLNFIGAILYFFARWLPRLNLPLPRYFNRWRLQRQLWNAEAAARNIGKDHQFVALGNILYEMGIFDRAADAYKKALERNPTNIPALWGAALVERETKNFQTEKEHLQSLLKLDPDYKYGEASVAYAQTLIDLQDWEAAKAYLEQHLKRWSHPEARLMIAEIAAKQGNSEEARNHLETMLINLRGSPDYYYRKKRSLVKNAEKLLRSLKR